MGGDPVEPGGEFCFCKESAPACGCDFAAPAGDANRLLMAVVGGERSAYLSDPVQRGSDPKVLGKVGRGFRKIGGATYKAYGTLYQAGGTPDRSEKLGSKASKLSAKPRWPPEKGQPPCDII